MTISKDPLSEAQPLDRVYFATGILLDAEDFRAEQNYHRGRLAHALAYLHGSGTAAGLEVEYNLFTDPSDGHQLEQLIVHPGLAIDRLGRVTEVPGPACLRLDKWFTAQDARDLTAAVHTVPSGGVKVEEGTASFDGVVVADVFLSFVACERGKTPAFASGPFDALDAVQPSRLRDSYQVSIILRREADLTGVRPDDPWKAVIVSGNPTDRQAALREAIFSAWPKNPEGVPPHPEYASDQLDKTAVFLCRLAIKVKNAAESGQPPSRPAPFDVTSVTVDNTLRNFVYSSQALAHVLDLV